MNTIDAIRSYIDLMLADTQLSGMKALLLDNTTTQIISLVYSQTQLLEKEIYLVERLGKSHETMSHLKAAVFIQPNEENFKNLKSELSSPKFSEYHIFLSNIAIGDYVTRLGRIDPHEVVRQVQEYYADYLPINEDFFHLGIDRSLLISAGDIRDTSLESRKNINRNVTGILSVLLSMKKKPAVIRYQSSSVACKNICEKVCKAITSDDIFHFSGSGPMVLIIDRRDDPITPLLTQWTFQAMVHELLGINNNRVSLKGAKGIKKDLEEVVLSIVQDEFFAKNKDANFGDLGTSIKGLLDDYQKKSKMNENITSIEQMQEFLERFPAFRSQAINVSKHVAVMGELARLTDQFSLLDISALEQEIACSSDHGSHKRELFEKIANPKIQSTDKIRMCVLYLLRYENYNELIIIKAKLSEAGITSNQVIILDHILKYAGESKRTPGLFSDGGIFNKMVKSVQTSINGVENVYTQHVPLLSTTLDSIVKGKLKDSAYPEMTSYSKLNKNNNNIKEIIVYMVGGATYEEATTVSAFNSANPEYRVILGGSCIHNSTSFTREILKTFATNNQPSARVN